MTAEIPGQGDLLDALTRVDEHADPDWKAAARGALHTVIRRGELFTTDDVWPLLNGDESTHEPRAMGALIRQAATAGLIRNTGTVRRSTRSVCHQRPSTVWEPTRYWCVGCEAWLPNLAPCVHVPEDQR